MKTKDCYTELSIQIATIESKIDKLLELVMKNQQQQFTIIQPTPSPRYSGNDNIAYCSGNAGGSEDEQFLENYK